MASGPAGWLRKGSPPKREEGREQRGIREERREEREERREKSAERTEKREEGREQRKDMLKHVRIAEIRGHLGSSSEAHSVARSTRIGYDKSFSWFSGPSKSVEEKNHEDANPEDEVCEVQEQEGQGDEDGRAR